MYIISIFTCLQSSSASTQWLWRRNNDHKVWAI